MSPKARHESVSRSSAQFARRTGAPCWQRRQRVAGSREALEKLCPPVDSHSTIRASVRHEPEPPALLSCDSSWHPVQVWRRDEALLQLLLLAMVWFHKARRGVQNLASGWPIHHCSGAPGRFRGTACLRCKPQDTRAACRSSITGRISRSLDQ